MEVGSDSEFVDVEGETFDEFQETPAKASRKRRISQVLVSLRVDVFLLSD